MDVVHLQAARAAILSTTRSLRLVLPRSKCPPVRRRHRFEDRLDRPLT